MLREQTYPHLTRISVLDKASIEALAGYTGAAYSYRALHYLPKCDRPANLISHITSTAPDDALPNVALSRLLCTLSHSAPHTLAFEERSNSCAAAYREREATPLERAQYSVLLSVPESASEMLGKLYDELKPQTAAARLSEEGAKPFIDVCLAALDLVLVCPRFFSSHPVKSAIAVLTEVLTPPPKLSFFVEPIQFIKHDPALRFHIRVALAYMALVTSDFEKASRLLAGIDYLAFASATPADLAEKPAGWKDVSGFCTLEEVLNVTLMTNVLIATRDFNPRPIVDNIINNFDFCSIVHNYFPVSPLNTFLEGWKHRDWSNMQSPLCTIAERMVYHPLLIERFNGILDGIHHFFIDYYMAPYSCVSLIQIISDFKSTQEEIEGLLIWLIRSGRFVGRLNIVDMIVEREEKEAREEAAEIVFDTTRDTVDLVRSIHSIKAAPKPSKDYPSFDFKF